MANATIAPAKKKPSSQKGNSTQAPPVKKPHVDGPNRKYDKNAARNRRAKEADKKRDAERARIENSKAEAEAQRASAATASTAQNAESSSANKRAAVTPAQRTDRAQSANKAREDHLAAAYAHLVSSKKLRVGSKEEILALQFMAAWLPAEPVVVDGVKVKSRSSIAKEFVLDGLRKSATPELASDPAVLKMLSAVIKAIVDTTKERR